MTVRERPMTAPSFPALIIFGGCGYAAIYFAYTFIRGRKVYDPLKRKVIVKHKPVSLALALMVLGWAAFAGLSWLTPAWYVRALWLGAGVTVFLLFGIYRAAVHDEHKAKQLKVYTRKP